eukprot:10794819-Alexandrium_andersonii.AAC.1
MASIRRADLARRYGRVGAAEGPSQPGRFWFPYRGGCSVASQSSLPMALQPGPGTLAQPRLHATRGIN